MKRKRTEIAIEFQDKKLKELSVLPYKELEKMLGRVDIESPSHLMEFSFAREISNDEFKGLEVSVFHYYIPSEEALEEVKKIIGNIDIDLGECQMRRWFNIKPSGKITWPSYELEDGED